MPEAYPPVSLTGEEFPVDREPADHSSKLPPAECNARGHRESCESVEKSSLVRGEFTADGEAVGHRSRLTPEECNERELLESPESAGMSLVPEEFTEDGEASEGDHSATSKSRPGLLQALKTAIVIAYNDEDINEVRPTFTGALNVDTMETNEHPGVPLEIYIGCDNAFRYRSKTMEEKNHKKEYVKLCCVPHDLLTEY